MATFITFQKRVVNWDANEAIVEEEPVATPVLSSLVIPQTSTKSRVIEPKVKTNNGNGHRSEFVRKINDLERAILKSAFLHKNGQIANDDCVLFKRQLSQQLAIFQITGYISVLHRYVALGRLELRDLSAYLNWMEYKYQGLWSQYNNKRFTAVRIVNTASRVNGQQPTANIPIEEVPIQTSDGVLSVTPVFKAWPRRKVYAIA